MQRLFFIYPSLSSFKNNPHFFANAKHIIHPKPATSAHMAIVNVHPLFSDTSAIPYPASAVPTYVHELSNPDINATFPNFLKCFGTIHINI